MQKERSWMREQDEQGKSQSEFIQRKSLCQLIYKKLEDAATITAGQYGQALETYPLLSTLYSLVKEFHTARFSQKPEKLDACIESAKKHDIPELQSFVEGILKDLTAIKNGIIYFYVLILSHTASCCLTSDFTLELSVRLWYIINTKNNRPQGGLTK